MLTFLIAGVRRIGDYWIRTPEERAYYWPGRQSSGEGPEPKGMELEGGKGECAWAALGKEGAATTTTTARATNNNNKI